MLTQSTVAYITLRPRQNGRHFADDVFKCFFLNENAWISPEVSLAFVHSVWIINIPPLVQIMARRRPGAKTLSPPMMVSLLIYMRHSSSVRYAAPGPTFIKPDQRNPWIKDQLWNDLLSTILHLQLPNFVSCGRDKPSHMTQNLVTVGVKL